MSFFYFQPVYTFFLLPLFLAFHIINNNFKTAYHTFHNNCMYIFILYLVLLFNKFAIAFCYLIRLSEFPFTPHTSHSYAELFTHTLRSFAKHHVYFPQHSTQFFLTFFFVNSFSFSPINFQNLTFIFFLVFLLSYNMHHLLSLPSFFFTLPSFYCAIFPLLSIYVVILYSRQDFI